MKTETLGTIVGRSPNANMTAFMVAMNDYGTLVRWDRPEVQAQIIGQAGHESGGFLYDREIWGPTSAQKGYENRSDLGHTTAVDGEAYTFRGKGPFQLTGRYNHRDFTEWCRKIIPTCPDFEDEPSKLLTDPYEGLTVIYYWTTRDLTRYALVGDIENITKKINGGFNGYADRIRYYSRAALVLLGRSPDGLRKYQADRGLKVDGIAGTNTRTALHSELARLPADVASGAVDPVAPGPTSPVDPRIEEVRQLATKIIQVLS